MLMEPEAGNNRPVPLITELIGILLLEQYPGLLGGQPVPDPHAQTLRAERPTSARVATRTVTTTMQFCLTATSNGC